VTGLEPAASGVTGRRSNQLSYTRVLMVGEYDTDGVVSMAERHFDDRQPGMGAPIDRTLYQRAVAPANHQNTESGENDA
jgi:hypothetical protein